MAYSLTYSGGTITVTDGTINTSSTSIALPGRNYAGYGGPVDQNMVSMLEHFASSTAGPINPIKGQVWFDTTPGLLKYNTGSVGSPNWVTLAAIGSNVGFNTITVTGNVDSGNVYANAGTIQASYIISTVNSTFAVQTGITAAGTTQGTATAITKDINVVSTVGSGQGIVLPTTVGGMRLTIVNTGANILNVYPATGAKINSASTNAAYAVAVGARLEFTSVTATQWYTMNATYN